VCCILYFTCIPLYIYLQLNSCTNRSDINKIRIVSDLRIISSSVRSVRVCAITMTAGETSDLGQIVQPTDTKLIAITDCLYSLELVRHYQCKTACYRGTIAIRQGQKVTLYGASKNFSVTRRHVL
jgi:hypothetical protein